MAGNSKILMAVINRHTIEIKENKKGSYLNSGPFIY